MPAVEALEPVKAWRCMLVNRYQNHFGMLFSVLHYHVLHHSHRCTQSMRGSDC
jgi:hypothetical protein